MKTRLYWLAVLPFAVATLSCNSSTTTTEHTDSTVTGNLKEAGENVKDAANAAATDVKQAAENVKEAVMGNPDSNFIVKAITNNKNEIAMLQPGTKMGTTKALKDHAKMMLTDHNKLQKKLEAYSAAKHYPVMPEDKATGELNNMKDKKGLDWDKAWTDKMIDGHKDNINAFEDARNNVKDADLKAMIDNTLPTLHSHLDMVTNLKNDLK